MTEPDYSYYDALLRYCELRYNPNHDPSNGRFCSGSGSGGSIPFKRQTEPTDKNSRNNNNIGDLTSTTKSVTMNMTVNAAGKPVKIVDHSDITGEPNSITQREAHVPGDPKTYIDSKLPANKAFAHTSRRFYYA